MLWLKPNNESLERLHREIALHQAAEDIAKPMTGFFAGLSAEQQKKALEYRGEESHGEDIAQPRSQKAPSMANTGAKGFAAVMKAHAEAMRKEFSKLADEVNSEFEVMKGHLVTGKEQVQQLKSDNAELREAFGIENDTEKG